MSGIESALATKVIGDLTLGSALAIGGAGMSAIGLASSLSAKPPQSAGAPPPVAAPAVMPIPDDTAAVAARRRQQVAASNRSGRASTLLSQGSGESDTLG